MKAKWTPGPWRIGDAGKTVFGPPCGLPPVIVANCDYQQTKLGGSKLANAKLIALAPELAAEIELVANALHDLCQEGDYKDTYLDDRYQACHALLARLEVEK